MQKILFVCIGNSCRSPMAEYIANQKYSNMGTFHSAGISPTRHVSRLTVEVLSNLYGIDAGKHEPQNVKNLQLSSFDLIVAMEQIVFTTLQSFPNLQTKLVLWEIDDPYGQGISKYENSAQSIEAGMENLLNLHLQQYTK